MGKVKGTKAKFRIKPQTLSLGDLCLDRLAMVSWDIFCTG